MPRKITWVVRIAHPQPDPEVPHTKFAHAKHDRLFGDETILECFRYAGLIRVHSDTCFDILPPHGATTDVWARQNAERMCTFGYNAAACPSTQTL